MKEKGICVNKKFVGLFLVVLLSSTYAMSAAASASLTLFEVAEHGDVKAAIVLIAQDANVNEFGVNQQTPLHVAAQNGHHELVVLLLREGAVVDAIASNGSTRPMKHKRGC